MRRVIRDTSIIFCYPQGSLWTNKTKSRDDWNTAKHRVMSTSVNVWVIAVSLIHPSNKL